MSGETPVIRLDRLTKIYGQGDAAVVALDGVSLEVPPGQFLAVMGHSGSGKSTLMNLLGFLDSPTDGKYWFQGVDVSTLDADQRALIRRQFVGFVFQGFHLLPRLSALENVEVPLIYQRVPAPERRRRALEALEALGLGDRVRHVPTKLSGGQQQRVAIARALVVRPSLLLADEPTGNLDSARSIEIMEILSDLNRRQGITVVLVTHEPDMALWAERIVEFRDGRILSDRRNDRRTA
ncbi:MAG TPA: ABC transporter ATP-binding protein [Myxococcota bacterium]|nr:ABC transporter ATP-binding protein [Myxococcota bacterium]HQK50347.1 ABC transporter ATP-binding protein [Myxococcota bacterium]